MSFAETTAKMAIDNNWNLDTIKHYIKDCCFGHYDKDLFTDVMYNIGIEEIIKKGSDQR